MQVEVTIPVYNEERDLPGNVRTLAGFLAGVETFESTIVIADNGSTDRTWALARELERELPAVRAVRIPEKGRGQALRTVWSQSTADIVSYMDVDLSTNVKFFPLLIHGLTVGYDVATGSRLLQASQVKRCLRRELISRCYNSLVYLMFLHRFSDAQCGFKALRRDIAHRLLPHIRNDGWFFDTEMMLLAEKHGMRIFEVPVEWIEDLDSRVQVMQMACESTRGLVRMRLAGFHQELD